MKFLPIESVRESDSYTIKNNISEEELIRNVGEALSKAYLFGGKTLVIAGSGNNGADGIALSLALTKRKHEVEILLSEGKLNSISEKLLSEFNVRVYKDPSMVDFSQYNTIVDGIYGTGFHGSLDDNHIKLINKINKSKAYKIAIDIPSGLNVTSGRTSLAFKADRTLAIEFLKPGYFLNDGLDYVGNVKAVKVGINEIGKSYRIYTYKDFEDSFPKRNKNSNKSSFGHTGLICGSINYSGASKLANMAISQLCSGAGLTSLIIPDCIADYVGPYMLDSIMYLLDSKDGHLSFNERQLKKVTDNLTSLGYGMGVTVSDDTKETLKWLLLNYKGRLLIDADGLNCLSEMDLNLLNESEADIILTPHPKEFSRLTGSSIDEILDDPVSRALEFTNKYNVTLLLKGTSTVISKKEELTLIIGGHPSLSKGGSGDILSGIITGIMAYKNDVYESACSGAFLQSLIGESLDNDYGSYSATASDQIIYLKQLLKM